MRAQHVCIFFAFDHEHDMIGGNVRDQLRQTIWDDPHSLDRPFVLIGSGALAKLFRGIDRFEAKYCSPVKMS
jgi:hypothetical protein